MAVDIFLTGHYNICGVKFMIYVVRHGQTDWNKEGKVQSRADIPLNEKGRKQAEDIHRQLNEITFDGVYSSELCRAIETAEIISGSSSVIKDERLSEVDNGKFEGVAVSEMVRIRLSPDFDPVEYGTESRESIRKRVFSFLDETVPAYSGRNLLIVSHAGTCKYIRLWFEGEPEDGNIDKLLIKNCQVLTYGR